MTGHNAPHASAGTIYLIQIYRSESILMDNGLMQAKAIGTHDAALHAVYMKCKLAIYVDIYT